MFNWLKNLFGGKKEEVVPTPSPELKKAAIEAIQKAEVEPVKKTPAKKATKKAPAKKEAADLDSMSKTALLAEAKKRGIKANASLKKDEILERIKNG